MALHPTARNFAEIILERLPRAGPSSLTDLYGFCGAKDGGEQYFVRQAVQSLTGDCRIRSLGQNLYAAPSAPEPQAPPAAAPDEPTPSEPAPAEAPHAGYDHRPVEPDETPPAISADGAETPTTEEREIMQTTQATKSTTRRNGGSKNGHGAKPAPWTGSKTDWTLAAVKAAGTAEFSDLFARAKKEGIFKEQKQLGATLSTLVSRKKLKRLGRGTYAVPGAKVVYDADKPAPAPKRTAADVKRVAAGRKAAARKPKPAPSPAEAPAAKPGRKASVFRGVYDEIDAKIAAARAEEKAAGADIDAFDAQISELQAKRKERAAKRDAAREAMKRLGAARKRVAETESGIRESLKY